MVTKLMFWDLKASGVPCFFRSHVKVTIECLQSDKVHPIMFPSTFTALNWVLSDLNCICYE